MIDGVRKEKERLTAAKLLHGPSFLLSAFLLSLARDLLIQRSYLYHREYTSGNRFNRLMESDGTYMSDHQLFFLSDSYPKRQLLIIHQMLWPGLYFLELKR